MNHQGNTKALPETDHVGPDGEGERGVPHRSPPEHQQCVTAQPTLPEDSVGRPLREPGLGLHTFQEENSKHHVRNEREALRNIDKHEHKKRSLVTSGKPTVYTRRLFRLQDQTKGNKGLPWVPRD